MLLGSCTSDLKVCLQPGRLFDAAIQLYDGVTKMPIDWPDGTQARLVFTWGTGTGLIIPAVVDGSWLRFSMTGEETELVPRGARAAAELNWTGDPDDWREWREGPVSCT